MRFFSLLFVACIAACFPDSEPIAPIACSRQSLELSGLATGVRATKEGHYAELADNAMFCTQSNKPKLADVGLWGEIYVIIRQYPAMPGLVETYMYYEDKLIALLVEDAKSSCTSQWFGAEIDGWDGSLSKTIALCEPTF